MADEILEETEPEFVANGVTFDGQHSYSDFDLWLATRPDTGVPMAKLNTVEVPGMDGTLDLTEANSGEVKYGNREMVLEFSAMVIIGEQEQFKAKIRNALHGKYINQIVLDEDTDWHYSGRANVEFTEIMPWKMRCVVTIDAAPYAMKNAATVVDLFDLPDAEVRLIDFGGTPVESPGTDLRWGTQAFPEGNFNWSFGDPNFTITWPAQEHYVANAVAYFFDGDGNYTYSSTIQVGSASAGSVNVLIQSITSGGVDISKIYRVVVTNLKGCKIGRNVGGYSFLVKNSRKTVVPKFALDQQTAYVIINSIQHEVNDTDEVYEDIVLKPGNNDVFVPVQSGIPQSPEPQPGDMTYFTMTFTEGKL